MKVHTNKVNNIKMIINVSTVFHSAVLKRRAIEALARKTVTYSAHILSISMECMAFFPLFNVFYFQSLECCSTQSSMRSATVFTDFICNWLFISTFIWLNGFFFNLFSPHSKRLFSEIVRKMTYVKCIDALAKYLASRSAFNLFQLKFIFRIPRSEISIVTTKYNVNAMDKWKYCFQLKLRSKFLIQ